MVDWPLSATHLYDVILISIVMFPHWLCFIGYKKKLDRQGVWRPQAFYKKKDDLLTQIEKTPEPPPPSWRSGIRCPVRTGPGHSALWLMGTGEVFFFYPQPEIHSHRESNSGPEGCRWNSLTTWARVLWHLVLYVTVAMWLMVALI